MDAVVQRNECEDRAHGARYNWFDLARFHYWCRSALFFAALWQETLYRAATAVETILLPFVKRFPRDFYETQEIVAKWLTVAWTFLNLQNADRSMVFIRPRSSWTCHKTHCKTPKSLPDIYEFSIENTVCNILKICIAATIQHLFDNFNKQFSFIIKYISIISLENIIFNVMLHLL